MQLKLTWKPINYSIQFLYIDNLKIKKNMIILIVSLFVLRFDFETLVCNKSKSCLQKDKYQSHSRWNDYSGRRHWSARKIYTYRTEVRIRRKYSNEAVYLFRVAPRPEHMLSVLRLYRWLFFSSCHQAFRAENARLAQKCVATTDFWSRHSVFFAKTPIHSRYDYLKKNLLSSIFNWLWRRPSSSLLNSLQWKKQMEK